MSITKAPVHIAMTLDGYTLENGSPITLDEPAQLINGRVMVPLRFVAATFGCQVDWNAANQEVDISSSNAESQAPPPSNDSTQEMQATQTVAQINQAIAVVQQNISDLNAQAAVSIETVKANYDPQILELQNEERAAEEQAVAGGGGLGQAREQEVMSEYDPQIQGLQQQEQAATDQINLTLQQGISQQNDALASYQAMLQQLNAGQ